MANVQISALPSTSSTTFNDWVIKNDSGETTTSKIQLKNMLGMTSLNGNNAIQSSSWLSSLGTTASTQSAIAIGNGAEATSPYSIAIGYQALNNNRDGTRDYYICIGYDSQAVQGATAFGKGTRAIGADSVAIGIGAISSGNGSFAMGNGAFADNLNSVSIGKSASNLGQNNISIGTDSNINNGGGCVAMGYNAEVLSDKAIAIGQDASVPVSSDYSVAIGASSRCLTPSSVCIGYDSVVTTGASVGIGSFISIDGDSSTGIGHNVYISSGATEGIGIGSNSDVRTPFGIGIGARSDVFNYAGTALGTQSSVTGDRGVAIGYDTSVSAAEGIVVGAESNCTHTNSVVLGRAINSDFASTTKTKSVQSTGQYFNAVQQLGSGTTFNIDWNNGGSIEFTLTGNGTCSMSNVRDGGIYRVKVTTTGNYSFTPSASGYTFIYEGGGFNLTNTGTDLCILHVFGTVVMVTHFSNFS